MSTTPRSDKAASYGYMPLSVPYEITQQLERELASEREKVKALKPERDLALRVCQEISNIAAATQAEVFQWKERMMALVGDDSPDGAGNCILSVKAEVERLTKERDALRACFADASHADVNAYTKWRECERGAAAMREFIENDVRPILETDEADSLPCQCAEREHGCERCSYFERKQKLMEAALSTDAGKGWISPTEHARLLLHIVHLESQPPPPVVQKELADRLLDALKRRHEPMADQEGYDLWKSECNEALTAYNAATKDSVN